MSCTCYVSLLDVPMITIWSWSSHQIRSFQFWPPGEQAMNQIGPKFGLSGHLTKRYLYIIYHISHGDDTDPAISSGVRVINLILVGFPRWSPGGHNLTSDRAEIWSAHSFHLGVHIRALNGGVSCLQVAVHRKPVLTLLRMHDIFSKNDVTSPYPDVGTTSRRRNVGSGGMHRSILATGFRSADTFY
jgi:hypothetical protein